MNTDKTSTQHWNTIYQSKNENEVSWYQEYPKASIELIKELNLPLSAHIIDIGGGESHLVDVLLEMGYTNISVLDISETALQKNQNRLGEKSKLVNWIATDITEFIPRQKYDLWHDRAAFHFLTAEENVKKYVSIAERTITQDGFLIMGTFSDNGPTKCSGLDTKQFTEESLKKVFERSFELKSFKYLDHSTPFNTIQNFLFCTFQRK
ncbi:MAG: methyltransferase domain-containing protein [Chlorobi bacterium]|jgi:2-polyprenyl-3-methyl-5-hydroxy-6-metoxy-1,4-benzoquinol methylase|uniref:Class I SAM-dependent methyltransferase n=2 Tax=Chryseobacterium TaxID=59732 RepID=A0AAJ1VL71_9FLAO|nr:MULTISPECIES: class I SAM-dependent methyltransferase [Flavobacteriales]NPA08047.1 methyltransferase domain-containing protein [Chlorobiota bacterium]MBF6645678.1 methyltransferase domain-containing protein [Chryseobacterium indologenes]MBU3049848.1 class I SAM-dependent methyltransferase [Chryseobacterium indologenes]MDN4011329.1 class I SAM-dependent methyltransferase [Chryseobacterium gambrini]NML59266.1 methyltransferase domain-containing protein [Chryseobacterium cheonjiense]